MVARVQHPAPHFKGTAVVDGGFEGNTDSCVIVITEQFEDAYNLNLQRSPSMTTRENGSSLLSFQWHGPLSGGLNCSIPWRHLYHVIWTTPRSQMMPGCQPKKLISIANLFDAESSPTEIIAYSDAVQQFASRGASIIFSSVDSEYSLLSWSATARKDGGLGAVEFPLLSDRNHKLSKDYGVFIEEEGIALRGLFLIDPKGIIRQVGDFNVRHIASKSLIRYLTDHHQRLASWTLSRRDPPPC